MTVALGLALGGALIAAGSDRLGCLQPHYHQRQLTQTFLQNSLIGFQADIAEELHQCHSWVGHLLYLRLVHDAREVCAKPKDGMRRRLESVRRNVTVLRFPGPMKGGAHVTSTVPLEAKCLRGARRLSLRATHLTRRCLGLAVHLWPCLCSKLPINSFPSIGRSPLSPGGHNPWDACVDV